MQSHFNTSLKRSSHRRITGVQPENGDESDHGLKNGNLKWVIVDESGHGRQIENLKWVHNGSVPAALKGWM
jgi:hypothetical protein